MKLNLQRIASVTRRGGKVLRVKWSDSFRADVDLSGWIATGGDILAPLEDEDLFSTARLGDYGSAIEWEGDDLAIDATHLRLIAEQQRPLDAKALKAWQKSMHLSNSEAAGFLKVGVSTWNNYKAGGNIPDVVSMLCRAAERDPVIVQAHLRPARQAGRPRLNERE